MIKDKKDIIVRGKDIIDKYIERNTSYEIQKAIALKIFSVSVLDGDGVIAACNLAAKLSGFSSEVVVGGLGPFMSSILEGWATLMMLMMCGSGANIK